MGHEIFFQMRVVSSNLVENSGRNQWIGDDKSAFQVSPCRCASLPTLGHDFSLCAEPFSTKFLSNVGFKIVFRMGVVSFDLVWNRARNGWASDGRSGWWFFVRLPRCVARARSAVCRASAQAGLHAKKKTQVTASDVVSSHVSTKNQARGYLQDSVLNRKGEQ